MVEIKRKRVRKNNEMRFFLISRPLFCEALMNTKHYLSSLALGISLVSPPPLEAIGENGPELDQEGCLHIKVKDAYEAYKSHNLTINNTQYFVRAHRMLPNSQRMANVLNTEGEKVLKALPYGKGYTIYHTAGGIKGTFDKKGRLIDQTDYIFTFRCEPLNSYKPETALSFEDSLLDDFVHIKPSSIPLPSLSPNSEKEDIWIDECLEEKPKDKTARFLLPIMTVFKKLKKFSK